MKFTKQILKNRLEATDEEIEVVLEYQKIFPMLIEEDVIQTSGRTLWEGLAVQQDFSHWIKKQLNLIEPKDNEYVIVWYDTNDISYVFKNIANNTNITNDVFKNVVNDTNITNDVFKNVVKHTEDTNANSMVKKGYQQDYIINIELAKEICMGIGFAPRTNAETKRRSKIARQYFILMEKFLKKEVSWQEVRRIEKDGVAEYKEEFMAYAIRQNIFKEKDRDNPYAYAYGMDLLNIIATGMSAREIKEYKEVVRDTRDNLEEEINKRISFLQDRLSLFYRLDVQADKIIELAFDEIFRKFNVSYKDDFNRKIQKYDGLF